MDPDTLGYFSKVLAGADSLLAIESIHALAKLGTAEAAQALQRAYHYNRRRNCAWIWNAPSLHWRIRRTEC